MPKKNTPAEKPADQFKRFVETARKLEVDESGKALDDAFRSITRKSAAKPTKTRAR